MDLSKHDLKAVITERAYRGLFKFQMLWLGSGLGLGIVILELVPVDMEKASFLLSVGMGLLACVPLLIGGIFVFRAMSKRWNRERELLCRDVDMRRIMES